ncbi:hypothetical protein [Ilumatobacter sp.]|uniref:hypothetical protein n=1 Tax=Ilumatobacter sp. TaxID=1967498 RepID=UPI00374FEECB
MPNAAKHADPEFRRIRDAMNRRSNANPGTTCRRCGLTLAERRKVKPKDIWTTGHPDLPGDHGYAPEHRSCNSSLGAQHANAKRLGFDYGL